MKSRSELPVRVGLTLALIGTLGLALHFSRYEWNFEPTWRYQRLYWNGLGITVGATACAYVIGIVLGTAVALARLSPSLPIRHLGEVEAFPMVAHCGEVTF